MSAKPAKTESADLQSLRETNRVLEEAVVERTRALMVAKQAWEATFDAIVDPLCIVSPDMVIVRANVAHAQQAERDVREISGRPCYEALFGTDTTCRGCPARATFATGEPHEGEVTDLVRGRTYRMSSFPKRPAGASEFDEVVCHYRDITEEKVLQQRLRQSEKMAAVGTLSGGVAHEINNPLGAILAFAQLALRQAEPGSLIEDFVSEIEDSAHRCKHIVASLLDFSRPSRGERHPVDMQQVVDQALFLCHTQYDRSHYATTFDVPTDLPTIVGDRNQLGQVALNLISNAFQAMESTGGGRVEMSLECIEDEWLVLVVRDNGQGIDDRYVAKIFEPFFTTKPEGKGTGLGLSISYSIVKDHGGSIEVESTLGEGTCFEVRLPLHEVAHKEAE
ncbi:MAG: two-component system NtrC family sensor kinase [Myxococcota bacterium]